MSWKPTQLDPEEAFSVVWEKKWFEEMKKTSKLTKEVFEFFWSYDRRVFNRMNPPSEDNMFESFVDLWEDFGPCWVVSKSTLRYAFCKEDLNKEMTGYLRKDPDAKAFSTTAELFDYYNEKRVTLLYLIRDFLNSWWNTFIQTSASENSSSDSEESVEPQESATDSHSSSSEEVIRDSDESDEIPVTKKIKTKE